MENTDLSKYINALLEKSCESYLMALEIINKPTIRYRTEGFCFFICNAWELLLKSFIIRKNKSIESINFKNDNKRTIGLDECINTVFTSTTDKTKATLSLVRSIRNKATHLILPEHDINFAPLFQKCVSDYNRFFQKQFPDFEINYKVSPYISIVNVGEKEPNSTLTLNPMALYEYKKIKEASNEEGISQRLFLYATKKENEADLKFAFTKDAQEKVTTINVPKDIEVTHPYTFTEMTKLIQDTLVIEYGPNHKFSKNSCLQIIRMFNLKDNQDYCYRVKYGKSDIPKYSQAAVDFITSQYLNNLTGK